MFNAVDLEHFSEPNPCTKCGFDLTDMAVPEPVVCTICGEVCYNSCKKGRTYQLTEDIRPCLTRVNEPLRMSK